jgi:ABC-2 type transport system permease protein
MARTRRTIVTSIVSPVISTSLYFIVFGSAIGGRMQSIDGIPYSNFIVPGLILLSILTESISNASFGAYMPKFTGMIYEILSAPLSAFDTVVGYVGAAVSKSLVLSFVILITARLFVDFGIVHPVWMVVFLVMTAISFSMLGFILGLLANGFEALQIVPALIIAPLTFLGGSFYSIHMLPPLWQKLTLFNPIVYLINGFRWSFFGVSEVSVVLSFSMTLLFMALSFIGVSIIFRTGYQVRT